MKRQNFIVPVLLLIICTAVVIVGCSTTPTGFDRAIANVQTNYVPTLALQTNVVTVTQTNTVVQTVTQTNSVGVPVPVYLTNQTTLVTYATNVVMVTNQVPTYTLTPSSTSTGVAQAVGTATNLFAPGVGGLVTAGILGALSIFLGFRNRQMNGQNDVLSQAAGVLAQTIETGREVLAKTPQGQAAADAFTQWMVSHQADTGTIATITGIVKGMTNNVQAQAAANQILALITPPAPPVTAAPPTTPAPAPATKV
jgi:hypothetical protein